MFSFTEISVTQFRNYIFQSFHFHERIIGICGSNGSGKTNLLDAVYYLCFTKSYFSRPDAQNVHTGMQGFRIEGIATQNNKTAKLVCILRESGRKEFSLNDEPYKKFSEHIGKFPCVMISPDDAALITGSSEQRRDFIDTILAQLHKDYLQHLIHYKKILEQRNSLLKAAENNSPDATVLSILDEQLIPHGEKIFSYRKNFLTSFLPQVQNEYMQLAGGDDAINLSYYSPLQSGSFSELLKQQLPRDIYLQRTGSGVHKDEIDITMSGMPFKNTASQGQRKTLLFALKLAEFTVLKEKKGFSPILLLDDVFEKMDGQRMNELMHRVCVQEKAQVFITDTHRQRLESSLNYLNVAFQLVELKN